MTASKTFSWLHLSDVHVGMVEQSWLWPTFKRAFFDDVTRRYAADGGWDVVVFSGDLVRTGAAAEFEAFEVVINEIWEQFDKLGVRPTLLTVPGNHDLARPSASRMATGALENYWGGETLRTPVFLAEESEYPAFIASLFSNYTSWRDRSVVNGIHAKPMAIGRIPGDASYVVRTNDGLTAGIVGLNSAWLQIGDARSQGSLSIDPLQLTAVTNGDADTWCGTNDLNLLVTHHPLNWQHPESVDLWNSEINPPGRFDLHLFGHMHEADTTSVARGGSSARRTVQASSLFGLDKVGGKIARVQGYSSDRVVISGASRTFTCWPRVLTPMKAGHRRLAPDQTLDLEEDGSFSLRLDAGGAATVALGEDAVPLSLGEIGAAAADFNLAKIVYHITSAPEHYNVRRIEQQRCLAALREKRAAWIIAEWGLGQDGFLAALQHELEGEASVSTYKLDLGNYEGRETFLSNVRAKLGVSFEQLCENISNAGITYLLLDDIPAGSRVTPGEVPAETTLEDLAVVVTEYAPDVRVLLRSRRMPTNPTLGLVTLDPLDEADVATYLRENDRGGPRYANPDIVSKLYQYTDGLPSRLDDALRELQVTSLSDLSRSNTDYGNPSAIAIAVPRALVSTVAELTDTTDDASKRSFELLRALSALPQGEQLLRIARLHGPIPFRALHATALRDRNLIDSRDITGIGIGQDSGTAKILSVPRPVREYVRSLITDEDARSLDRKAITLYFGENWNVGDIASSATGRRISNSLCDFYEIDNAGTLILRFLQRATEDENDLEIEAGIRLASAFVEALILGSHYRSAASFCESAIPLVTNEIKYGHQLNIFRYELARATRMTGKNAEARDLFDSLDLNKLSKSQKQTALTELSFCYERLGAREDAARTAKAAIKIDRQSSNGMHAEAVLVGQIFDPRERDAKRKALQERSARKKYHVVANNIALERARDTQIERKDETATDLFRAVVDSSKKNDDFYNGARAVVDLALLRDQSLPMDERDKTRLISAYHFLYNERMPGLFDRCHEGLWNAFEASGEIGNLLSLFRHSSLIWRLRGRDAEEARYLGRLARLGNASGGIALDVRLVTRDRAYFQVRLSFSALNSDRAGKA